jgi:hypothetical protein
MKQTKAASIAAPGFYGLNSQDSGVTLASGFATKADNCVIDKFGRIGARKGWTKVNSTAFNSSAVKTVFEFVKADNNLIFAAAGNKIFGQHPSTGSYVEYPVGGVLFCPAASTTYNQTGTTVTVTHSSHGYTTGDTVYFGPTSGTADEGIYVVTVTSGSVFTFTSPSSETTSGSANCINILTTYSITDDNWQAINMPLGTGATASAHAIWVQSGHLPLVMHKLGTAPHTHVDGYGFQRLGDIATFPGTYTVNTFKPSCGIYAFGRLWVANVAANDTQTVYFTDIQDPSDWTTGTAGYLDISAVIPTGDPIIALAQHNGFLIIFCQKHIVIYSGAADPATMKVEDIITNIGCIARDSVASVAGTDILFLSDTGVQSLLRLTQERSLPLRDVSKNVRDELMSYVNGEVLPGVKGTYYPNDAMYLLALPVSKVTYCFDTRGTLENGSARATVWNQINPTAFCIMQDRSLYLGEVGYIGKYNSYQDNGTKYRLAYFTNYFDLDAPTNLKILKKLYLTAIGGSSQPLTVKWGFDYSELYRSSSVTLPAQTSSYYNVDKYNEAKYSDGVDLINTQTNLSGNGKVIQLGFETDINGNPLSIQKIDLFYASGKTT